MGQRSQWVTYQDKKIMHFDFSQIMEVPEYLQILKDAQAFARESKAEQILLMINFDDSINTHDVTEAQKILTKYMGPLCKKTALVGIDPLKRVIAKTIVMLTGTRTAMNFFETQDEAKAWLVSV